MKTMTAEAPTNEARQFLDLLEPIEAELERYCRRLIWDPQEVPDAVHNALARAIRAFDRYHEGTNFRAWMFKILTHEVFALNRKHHRIAAHEFALEPEAMAELAAAFPDVGTVAETAGDHWEDGLDQNLVFALRTLSDPERATLLLRAIAGFKYQEISDALEMPVGSVMGYLGRARKKMRHALAASAPDRFGG
jgi:RNA polymerase sigma-70 factor (ECF subfamily)